MPRTRVAVSLYGDKELYKLLHRHQVNTAVSTDLAEVIVPNAAIGFFASSQCPVKISALWGFDVKDEEDPVILS